MQRILVIDDDPAVTSLLKRGLSYEGFAVETAGSGAEGLAIAREHPSDLVILDVMMPGLSGFEVLERLRAADEQLPVLMLTARDTPVDQVQGLESGADDYVVKPFTFSILLARIHALLRRRQTDHPAILRFADLALDTGSHVVRRGQRTIPLTSLEFKVLQELLIHAQQVLSKEGLLERVWGYDFDANVVEVYVKPMHQGGTVVGYIEALTPLGRLDASIQAFRILLPALGLTSLTTALLLSWAIAGRALRPVARMTRTAQTITLSQDLTRRIAMPAHQDELGRLAKTFNEMLSSIEAAYRAQQRFISDASHELRAPLTAIQGNLELLSRHRSMPEAEREEALTEVTREANRLSRLVANLLALARADAGVPLKHRLLELDEVVLDAFREARQLSQGQTLTLDPFEPVQVAGDEDRLKQLVLILLDNALKYTPAQGHVTLGLQREASGSKITVRDTGVGIPPGDLPHVFERFYRADPARGRDPGGTGLGLPIARWIVEQHGGKITLESQLGQGTLATIYLPHPGGPPLTPLSTPQQTLSQTSA